jgi:hypothetical protein
MPSQIFFERRHHNACLLLIASRAHSGLSVINIACAGQIYLAQNREPSHRLGFATHLQKHVALPNLQESHLPSLLYELG